MFTNGKTITKEEWKLKRKQKKTSFRIRKHSISNGKWNCLDDSVHLPIALQITTNVHVEKSFTRNQIRHFYINCIVEKLQIWWKFSWQKNKKCNEPYKSSVHKSSIWQWADLRIYRYKLIVTDVNKRWKVLIPKVFTLPPTLFCNEAMHIIRNHCWDNEFVCVKFSAKITNDKRIFALHSTEVCINTWIFEMSFEYTWECVVHFFWSLHE